MRAGGQLDQRLRAIDGKLPEIAGDVPIKLVVTRIEADLAVRRVKEREAMCPGSELHIRIADLHALAVCDCGNAVGLAVAVERDRQDIEADADAAPVLGIRRREIA